MNTYLVIKQIGDFEPRVVRSFANEDDAMKFAALLDVSEENHAVFYHVAKLLTV